jgi:hypothetical protein
MVLVCCINNQFSSRWWCAFVHSSYAGESRHYYTTWLIHLEYTIFVNRISFWRSLLITMRLFLVKQASVCCSGFLSLFASYHLLNKE